MVQAEQIARACRQVTPDITDEEISHFIRVEGPALRRNRSLNNPMGALIRHIPRCCRSEDLRLYREVVRLNRRQKDRQIKGWLRDARAILENPAATDYDRDWAQAVVQSYGVEKE